MARNQRLSKEIDFVDYGSSDYGISRPDEYIFSHIIGSFNLSSLYSRTGGDSAPNWLIPFIFPQKLIVRQQMENMVVFDRDVFHRTWFPPFRTKHNSLALILQSSVEVFLLRLLLSDL